MLRWLLQQKWFAPIVVEAGFGLLLFWLDPLGIASQRNRQIDNWVAVATQYLSIGPPKDLAVLLIDPDALAAWKVDWPVSDDRMADLVHELACARAKGVFFDFTAARRYGPNRNPAALRDAVEDSARGPLCADGRGPDKIPVFFGKIEHVDSGLNAWLEARKGAFLLAAGEEEGVYQTGKEAFPDRSVAIADASPAFALMREVAFGAEPAVDAEICADADPRPSCWRWPLMLQWNAGLDPAQRKVSRTLDCRGDPGAFGLLWGATPWGGGMRFEPCPPVLTLRALDLERDLTYVEANGDPAEQLAGRFVFVGVDLPGLNDKVATPVHDHLPGVYKHAVALGELIHYGANYPTLPPPALLYVLVAATYLWLAAAGHASRGRPREHWLFGAAFLAAGGAFAGLIYHFDWPASLIFAVLGTYGAVAAGLFAARWGDKGGNP